MRGLARARSALLGALAAGILSAALPAAASAGVLVNTAPSCDNGDVSQPFARWGDDSHYFLAPGGDFEGSLAGWALSRSGAASDQEPWEVAGDGSHALVVRPGGSAVTPTMCVGIEHPTMRFFAHRSGGGLLGGASQLVVSARVETSAGLVVEVPVGTVTTVTNGNSWNRTPVQVVLVNLLPLLPGKYTPVQFRFTPIGTADWVIDDVYVDPRSRA
jgi:hypothetical protein